MRSSLSSRELRSSWLSFRIVKLLFWHGPFLAVALERPTKQ